MSLLTDIPDFTKQLTVVINEDDPTLTRRFTVTEEFLVEHSAFFQAACRSEWKEATSRIIKLPDVDNDTFYAYLYWVYKERIPFDTECDRGDSPVVYVEEALPTLNKLVSLWLLADRLLTAKLRNAVADALLSVLDILDPESDMPDVFPASTIAIIWHATTRDRALRRIVIDFYAYMVHPKAIESSIEDYHPDFARDLALKGLSIHQGIARNMHPCEQKVGHYHELDKPQPCSNIHGHAALSLKDKDKFERHAQSKLLSTPKDYISAVHKAAQVSEFEPEVKMQIKDDEWVAIKESRWGESFGKIAESNHCERVSFSIVFDYCKFSEEQRRWGVRV